MKSVKKFTCKICNKNYKSIQSLCNHNRRFHKKITQNNTHTALNSTQTAPNSTKKINKINNKKCPYCNLTFTRLYSKNRHMKICKIKNEKENSIILKMEKEKNEYKNEIKRLKQRLRDKMNKNCKIHYKTLQKINNQLNNNITKNNCVETINNIHNRNIINFNLVGFGKEEFGDVLSNKEQLKILKKKFNSLPYMIDYVHFNKNYPQYMNFIITSIKNNIAYKYDDEKKQFIAGNKDELLNELIDNRMFDIDTFYNTHIDKLNDKCKEVINRFLDKYNNDKLDDSLKNDINLVVYNNMNKVVDKYKVSVKQNLDKILTYDDLIKEKNNMENKFNTIIESIKLENKSIKDDYKLLKKELEKLKNKK
tara:strand:+ start:243 stop:1337 length:1095 start_codon:yes stop_codon:yes gene_type:complete